MNMRTNFFGFHSGCFKKFLFAPFAARYFSCSVMKLANTNITNAIMRFFSAVALQPYFQGVCIVDCVLDGLILTGTNANVMKMGLSLAHILNLLYFFVFYLYIQSFFGLFKISGLFCNLSFDGVLKNLKTGRFRVGNNAINKS